jgi:hypothetical protein
VAHVFRYMQSDPRWLLEGILENHAAIFILIQEPPPEMTDDTVQPFNNHWDYGFGPLPARARLVLSREIGRIRREAAPCHPRTPAGLEAGLTR